MRRHLSGAYQESDNDKAEQIADLLCKSFRASVRRWFFSTPLMTPIVLMMFAATDALMTGLVAAAVGLFGMVLHGLAIWTSWFVCSRCQVAGYVAYSAAMGLLPLFVMPESVNGQIALLLLVAIALAMNGVAMSAHRPTGTLATLTVGVASIAAWTTAPTAFDPSLPAITFAGVTLLSLGIVDDLARQHVRLATSSVHVLRGKQIDPLTDLYRRSTFLDLVEKSLIESGSGGLYFIDIDRFKVVNDTLGHQAGDQLLRTVAHRVQSVLGPDDFAGRIGGDEIGVYIPGQTPDVIASTALRLTGIFEDDFRLIDHQVPVAATISAVSTDPSSSGAALMHQADIAMHAAKRDGRRLRVFDNQMRAELVRLEQTELDLRAALKNDEIGAHLQPIIDLATGTVCNFEALGRWTRADSSVPAADFFVSAKQSNLLPDITRAVATDLMEFSDSIERLSAVPDRSDVPTLGINVEAGDLGSFLAWLDDQPVDPTNWMVELTETQILNNYEEAVRDVRRAVDMGIGVVLDDFGTGYSSLYRILHLPISGLKIDASFVAQLLHSHTARTIVSSTVHIANSCGLYVVAEGVETYEQASALLDLGVTRMQGYYFCRPVSLQRSLAVVQEIKADNPGPVALRPTSHLQADDHFTCNYGDIKRLVVKAQLLAPTEQRSFSLP